MKTPYVPRELTERPFSLREARAAGLTHSALSGNSWRRIGCELYCWRGMPTDPWRLLVGWQRSLGDQADFSGATAAWIWGFDSELAERIEVVVPRTSGVRSRSGLLVHRCDVMTGDRKVFRGLRLTSVARTLCDLCVARSEVDALICIDIAVRRHLAAAAGLVEYAANADGRAGAGRLRRLAKIAAPAESPMETRMRWLLVRARLPYPAVQVDLKDHTGRFLGRADLYYPTARLALEYDGDNHRDRMAEDNRRQNLLLNAGYRLLRFTASDIYRRPDVVITQTREALGTRLAPTVPRSGW
ncbi:MAG TPA: DUF559 domain-containing protein [Candidatus Dormibacteraeota bacterium]|nr:DUF559 domain-containing protein [Candidatus Dormibacteraeota bacterium]